MSDPTFLLLSKLPASMATGAPDRTPPTDPIRSGPSAPGSHRKPSGAAAPSGCRPARFPQALRRPPGDPGWTCTLFLVRKHESGRFIPRRIRAAPPRDPSPRKAPLHKTRKDQEKAILVGAILSPETEDIVREHLDELEALTETMGAEVVERLVQDRDRIDPATYIGKGKAEELAGLVDLHEAHLAIFDVELSPAQKKNLEKILPEGIQVLDRSSVILEIFARHARTHEAKTQVELARLEYLLPRLTSRWTHLHRQRGGIGLRGGEGETQLEVDRRMTQKRIASLRQELEKIDQRREVRSQGRSDLYKIALVGYTNAGKSSLMNALTDAGVLVQDQLFSTLDSTIRAWELEDGRETVLIDTVGFIRKLPHQLVASFRSTLAEAEEADLILNVVDVSHDRLEEQMATTEDVLADMGLQDKPRILVLNKADRLDGNGRLERLGNLHPEAVVVSAATGQGLDRLREAIQEEIRSGYREAEIVLPNSDGRSLARLHQELDVLDTAYTDGVVHVRARGKPEAIAWAQRLAEESRKNGVRGTGSDTGVQVSSAIDVPEG